MTNRYTGVFEEVSPWWVGYVEEMPGCNVQEATLDEARESLREAIRLVIEANRTLARCEAQGHDVIREEIVVSVGEA